MPQNHILILIIKAPRLFVFGALRRSVVEGSLLPGKHGQIGPEQVKHPECSDSDDFSINPRPCMPLFHLTIT